MPIINRLQILLIIDLKYKGQYLTKTLKCFFKFITVVLNNWENLWTTKKNDVIVGFLSAEVTDIISNKKASLGNSLVWLGFDWVGATGFEPAT